jgi:hypothetical protein
LIHTTRRWSGRKLKIPSDGLPAGISLKFDQRFPGQPSPQWVKKGRSDTFVEERDRPEIITWNLSVLSNQVCAPGETIPTVATDVKIVNGEHLQN